MHARSFLRSFFLIFSLGLSQHLGGRVMTYEPAPVDNPLKGLVPYASALGKDEMFPHSMEFCYLGLGELLKGKGRYDWGALENALETAKKGRRQLIFRVYLEYPGKADGLPRFLLEEGVKVTVWEVDGKKVVTPDYGNLVLRRTLCDFVAAMGKRYDGDPRVAFVTAGLLGLWGEWHNYPRADLQASREVQAELTRSFEAAFSKTKILLRYPAGPNDESYADNREARVGYHDDSFAWATLPRAHGEDGWFFLPKLQKAGVAEKWKRFPIGGEIRPEIWGTVFTSKRTGQEQDFRKCVEATHVSWLMDTGMFSREFPQSAERTAAAAHEVRRMGYELHVREVEVVKGMLRVTVENRGVAPFYDAWPIELRAGNEAVAVAWDLRKVLPGKSRVWTAKVPSAGKIKMRVPNVMTGGRALRFANAEYRGEWLILHD